MPACIKCSRVQSRLNNGQLCKKCYNDDIATECAVMNESKQTASNPSNEYIRINDSGKYAADILEDDIIEINVETDYKDALLASLYSQVEFLKKRN